MRRSLTLVAVAVLALGTMGAGATAKDKVRLVDSQPTVFDAFAIYHAQAEGYFEAENLDDSVIVGRGGAGSLQGGTRHDHLRPEAGLI